MEVTELLDLIVCMHICIYNLRMFTCKPVCMSVFIIHHIFYMQARIDVFGNSMPCSYATGSFVVVVRTVLSFVIASNLYLAL